MSDDEANETPAPQEAPAAPAAEAVAPEAVNPAPPPKPFFFLRAPSRFLITASGPNDDRFVLDTLSNILVCIQRKDDARRLHFYTPEPPEEHREVTALALSALTGEFPATVPDDAELLVPIEGLPAFLRLVDMQPGNRQDFILATAGPRLYRPFLNEYGQLFNLDPVLTCCSGWESTVPYVNEVGDIYAWFSWQPPLPKYF